MRPDCSTALTQVRSRRGRNRSLPYSLSVPGSHRRRAAMSTTISSNRPGGGIKWRWPSVHPEGRKFLLIAAIRSEEHTSELQSLMRISYAVFCLKKKTPTPPNPPPTHTDHHPTKPPQPPHHTP